MNKELCQDCYFLSDKFNQPVCTQDEPHSLREKRVCISGPMVKMPQTDEDLRRIVQMTEKQWRRSDGTT